MITRADYIVVGGGSSGAVVASRLSEDPRNTVLLLEAGGEGNSLYVKLPVGFAKMLNNANYDWCYMQEPDASIKGRHFVWSAGKMLGGGSSINGQVYIRGSKADYARWVDSGCPGWSFDECLPFFLRSEGLSGNPSEFHGREGPLSVVPLRDPHPLCASFIAACKTRGIASLEEYCNGNMDGAFMTLATQFPNGERCSTAHSFLSRDRRRSNLHVITGARVQKLVFDKTRCTGVIVDQAGQRFTVVAGQEVIVCAGTIGSPTLLMRSGIGPADHLTDKGIQVICASPEVGENLQEHAAVGVSKFVDTGTYNSETSAWDMVRHVLNYLVFKKGPLVSPAVQAMAFARTHVMENTPDVQLHFLPLAYDIKPETVCAANAQMTADRAVMIIASTCRPWSRGRVRLRSDKCEDLPQVFHQLLGDDRDLHTLVDACKLIETIFASDGWGAHVIGHRSPALLPGTDAGWQDYVRSHATIGYHPVGTCRMGSNEGAVVDLQLRVRGIQGLRIADASVMPTVTSGNTNATAIMIGERAADFLSGGRQ